MKSNIRRKSRLLLLALLGVFLVFADGGLAKLTQGPPLDRSLKSDAAPDRSPHDDREAELKKALSSSDVVSVIIELQSEPVAVHENMQNPNETREGKLNLESAAAQVYESQLVTEQENFKQLARQLSPNMIVRTELRTLLNAISLEAPGVEIAAITMLPGVKSVQLTREYHALLNKSVTLINAPAAWTKVGGSGSAGQGIKIAILDTGIDITNALFADAGFTSPAGFPKGNSSFTNNKVIAAKAFLADGAATPGDQNGHGTNVAGIAAGDLNTTSPLAQISGVAPRAFLGNYRVLDSSGSGRDDKIIEALQEALHDGFEIASLSLGATADPTLNVLDQAVENAVSAGMIVVVAAGNSGDNGSSTIGSPGVAPSAITVGSSTNSHVVGAGASITVAGTVPSNLSNIGATVGQNGAASSLLAGTLGPAVYADVNALDGNNRGCAGLPAGTLSGKIALIERGNCTFATKVNTASVAGALGAVIYNKDVSEGADGGDMNITMDVSGPPPSTIPSAFVGRTSGLALRDWLRSHAGAQLSMSAVSLIELTNPVDVLSSFSSRGPSSLKGLKPDLAAPGDQIYSGAITTSNSNGVSDPSGFTAASGTSQATPHVAGAAALLKQLHQSWTPLQIKSALISSANNAVSSDSSKTANAGVLDVGAGRLDLSLGSSVNATFSPASLSFGFVTAGVHASIDLQVTNQTAGAETYAISVQDLGPGSGVSVSPSVNSVSPAAGQSATVTINLNSLASATLGDHTGCILVTDQNSQTLRVPYWVRIQPPPTVQFIGAAPVANFSVTEGSPSGVAHIVVNRLGDTSSTATVDYATSDGTASQRTQYVPALGTLTFLPGQLSASFDVIIIDDLYVEQTSTVNLTLSNAVGAALGSPKQAIISIDDNDGDVPATTNPLDTTNYFVTQHYYDFLNRLPDPGGLAFWSSLIDGPPPCANGDNACLLTRHITVSNAFFFELEYQQTGSYVFRLYRTAFGNNQPFPNPDGSNPAESKKLPGYDVFSNDRAKVVGGSDLAQSQLAVANAFVQRAAFLTKYPASLAMADQFVDAMLTTIQSDLGVNLSSQRPALITLYNSGGRGAVLYRLADDNTQTNPINNRSLIDAEYNRAFVATQYFGYLRRDSDIGGFLFWLGQVNSAPLRDTTKQHAMVCSFITSDEYQQRFSPVVTHHNSECH